ncbi:hypothetical protein ACH4VT_33240 [Streptomyces lydicus]|uniref:hypothetical protein n=1 Tax=Streptomyces lydicus TaxID=47763 RepID=UPI00379DB0F3
MAANSSSTTRSASIEGAGRFGGDAGAALDDPEVSHLLTGPHVHHVNLTRP